ncbi:MAG: hypothetical protein R3323_02895 [Wenzhouxiangellaceae bacterium]|nr:hypothetical protein [Wenzhouxiangellaceae bacterium]
MNRRLQKRRHRSFGAAGPRVLAVIAVAALLAACGPLGVVDKAPPGIELDRLEVDGDRAAVHLLVHNRNDIAMALSAVRLEFSVAGDELLSAERSRALEIGVRGREPLEIAAPARRAALRALEPGSDRSERVAFTMTGTLTLEGQADRDFTVEGFLHPVPGRPGTWR